MYGVFIGMSPIEGITGIEAIKVEDYRTPYARFEIMRNGSDTDNMMRAFEREMRRRYERAIPRFDSFLPDKTPPIKKVIFNDPATIVLWKDGTKTVVKCQDGDIYSKELGLAMCISKKYLGNKGNFNNVFKKWIPEEELYTEEYFTEEKLLEIVESIDVSKIKESLRNGFYNIGKSLVKTYKPSDPVEETPEKDGSQVEEETTETEGEKIRLSRGALLEGLHRYCKNNECLTCILQSDCEKSGRFETLSYSQLSDLFDEAYKKEEE